MLDDYLECYEKLLDEWLEKGKIEDNTHRELVDQFDETILIHSYEDVGMAVKFAYDYGQIDKRLFYRPDYFIASMGDKERNVDTRGIWSCKGIDSNNIYLVDHYAIPMKEDLVLQQKPNGLLTLRKYKVGLTHFARRGVVIGMVL